MSGEKEQIGSSNPHQSGPSNPRDLHRLFAERASAGDLDGLLELYEDGALLVTPDGRQSSEKEEIRASLGELLDAGPVLNSSAAHAYIVGDIALMSSPWSITLGGTEEGGGMTFEGESTEIARRRSDGSWRYVLDMPSLRN